MAKDMTALDVAEWILEILVKELGLMPGDVLPDHKLKERYRARGGDSADIRVGLEYAASQEWLDYDGAKGIWRLTELGHEYP